MKTTRSDLIRSFFLAESLISDRQVSPYMDRKTVLDITRKGNRKRFVMAIRMQDLKYAERYTN